MTFTISFDAFTVPAEEQYHRLKECLYRISGIQRRRERASPKKIIAARGTVISRSQERMIEQVKTSMEVTRQSILQFEAKRKDDLQNDEHQESLESNGNLQQVLNHAFKFMAIIYEYKKAGVLTPDSDSRPVKEVEVTSQRTVEIERETLACMCRAIREKETEWSSKDLSNNSKSEVVGHIVGNLSIFLTNLEANKKVRSMCPGLNALANSSYIQESGSGITVFDFAKALHKVYQIPLLSAVNIAFETEQNCHITRNRIDLDRIKAKPKLHDSFVNGKPRFIRRAKDAQLLLCPHGTQPNNGLETSKEGMWIIGRRRTPAERVLESC